MKNERQIKYKIKFYKAEKIGKSEAMKLIIDQLIKELEWVLDND